MNTELASACQCFGLYDEEELKSILLGLSAAYPEYINATFTNDLQTITLRDKTSNDVLNLLLPYTLVMPLTTGFTGPSSLTE